MTSMAMWVRRGDRILCAKIAYATKVEALLAMSALELMATAGDRPYAPTSAYQCPRCRRWHLTSRGA